MVVGPNSESLCKTLPGLLPELAGGIEVPGREGGGLLSESVPRVVGGHVIVGS